MRTKTFHLLFLLAFVNTVIAQQDVVDSTKYQEVFFNSYNKQKALSDIEIGKVKILLPGGIVGAAERVDDVFFEKKYGIRFYSQGCTRSSGENEPAYNEEIFKYLDQKFGKEWRSEIRTDAIGLKSQIK